MVLMFSGVPLSCIDVLAIKHLTKSTTGPGIRNDKIRIRDENIKMIFDKGLSS